jgi:hypothetical protein
LQKKNLGVNLLYRSEIRGAKRISDLPKVTLQFNIKIQVSPLLVVHSPHQSDTLDPCIFPSPDKFLPNKLHIYKAQTHPQYIKIS